MLFITLVCKLAILSLIKSSSKKLTKAVCVWPYHHHVHAHIFKRGDLGIFTSLPDSHAPLKLGVDKKLSHKSSCKQLFQSYKAVDESKLMILYTDFINFCMYFPTIAQEAQSLHPTSPEFCITYCFIFITNWKISAIYETSSFSKLLGVKKNRRFWNDQWYFHKTIILWKYLKSAFTCMYFNIFWFV